MFNELRYRHLWIFGQTGTGKTTIAIQNALYDIDQGDGVLFIEPHGTDTLLSLIPKHRQKDVVVFDPSDEEYPIAWNPLEIGNAYTASTYMETFKAIWGYDGMSTPQLDQILYNATVAMLDTADGTLLGMYYLLTNGSYRHRVIDNIKDPIVRSFWMDFDELSGKDQRELVRSTVNKIQMLVADPRIRNIVAQPRSKIHLPTILDERKIFIVRLPLKHFGEQKIGIIGSLILAQLIQVMPYNTQPFHIYIDDLQFFQTPVVRNLLATAGRYQISLTLTNQYLSQLRPDILHALLGNVGTKIAFRTGITDAQALSLEFEDDNIIFGLSELPPYMARIVTPAGTYERRYDDPDFDLVDTAEKLVKLTRRSYASQKKHIEPKIEKFVAGLHG